jgi:putative hydrolase of the HAD superfamily
MRDGFSGVETWVFDLDNTLYPPSIRLFDQIEVRMTEWVMQALRVSRPEADRLRSHYWRTYGTTLAGLMREHGVDPLPYLVHVHNISLDALGPDPTLARAIRALPGRKIVHTNGSRAHAGRVTAARGLSDAFDACYGIEDAGFLPKPERTAFLAICALGAVDPSRAAMFEDDPANLREPHALGMRTIHVHPQRLHAPHIHHHTDDLTRFLARLGP